LEDFWRLFTKITVFHNCTMFHPQKDCAAAGSPLWQSLKAGWKVTFFPQVKYLKNRGLQELVAFQHTLSSYILSHSQISPFPQGIAGQFPPFSRSATLWN
jgi:hypothetical protein